MNTNSIDIVLDLLKRAKQKGASMGDIVLVEGESSTVQVRMGTVDKLSNSKQKRLGLRLFFGKRTAISSTADLSPGSLDDLLSTTCSLAQTTSEDSFAGLPEPNTDLPSDIGSEDLEISDPEMMNVSMQDRIDMAKRAESSALAEDTRITNSEGGDLSLDTRRIAYANSNGFSGGYSSSSVSLSVSPIATLNGSMQRDFWYSMKRKLAQLDSPESIGKEAAHRTVRRLGSRKIQSGSYPVVFDPETAGELLGSLSSAVNGYSIYKGASFLVGRLDQMIASKNITVVDDGTLPSGLGTRPFDGEGIPTRKTTVIENGVLRNYLLDSYSARKLGRQSTGNAARSVGDAPVASPTNFYMAPGPYSPTEIIRKVKSGLYVTEMIGFGVNLVTGDYSRGASGIWIENGEFAYPVEGITIAGNLKEMLRQVEMVGNDLSFRSTMNAPTLLLAQMTLAGD